MGGLGLGPLGRGLLPWVTISWGPVEDSRLARLVAVMLVDVNPKLTGSLPRTSEVTSH